MGPVSDQRRWDSWARFTDPVLSKYPMLACLGNHEIESQSSNNGLSFASSNSRYPQPVDGGLGSALKPMYSQDYLNQSNTRQFTNEATYDVPNSYWGVSMGPAHIIGLNTYAPYGPTSKQVAWFKNHVKTINRAKSPWLFVIWHTAAYHTYNTHFRELDAFLDTWEPLLKDAGVDVVLNGHVHAYERTYPMYNYTRDDCGPAYITVGDGGNIEGLYKLFIDNAPVPAFCSDASKFALPSYQPTPSGLSVLTYPASFNGSFCPQSQPNYSAFREPAFGSGILDVFNSTHAKWTWYRAMPGQPEVLDQFVAVKNPSCPKQYVPPNPLQKPSKSRKMF